MPRVTHTVLLKFKPSTPADVVAGTKERLEALNGTVAGMASLCVRPDAGLAEGNHTLVLRGDFDSAEAYTAYAKVPRHLAVVQWFKPHLVEGGRAAVQHTAESGSTALPLWST